MPRFSIVIFTKNRSDLIGFALESVLNQTFPDFEVIIADNDDTDATAKVLSRYEDSRIRYQRTGSLSMIDNWEAGVSLASGEFVLSLTDRSAFRSYALEKVNAAIERYRQDVYIWSFNYLSESLDAIFSADTKPSEVVSSNTLLEIFLTQPYAIYSAKLPRGLNSCQSRALLDEIKRRNGRFFLPISPDYTLAFITLAHRSQVVLLNEPLFLWGYGQLSTGGGLYRNSDTRKRFLHDAGLAEDELISEVPIKTNGIHNCICNDLLKLRRQYPELPSLDLVSYFLSCRSEIEQWLIPGDPRYAEKMAAWSDALAKQSPETIAAVQTSEHLVWYRKVWRAFYNSSIANTRKRTEKQHFPQFENILEATRWIEDQEAASTEP